jgi:Domain of unknown function (DUF222)/HNH endonuclease
MFITAAPAPTDLPVDLPADLAAERIATELCTLAGQIAAATSRFLRLLAEFDQRDGWGGWGMRSCAHWLSWRCGLDLRTAHEYVRVARALTGLPRLQEAFDAGQLSYSKIRALTRVATPLSESDLLEAALHAPAAHVERLVRGLRTATDNEEDHTSPGVADRERRERRERQRVSWSWDCVTGELVISGRLGPAEGARLLAAVTRAQAELDRTAEQEPAEQEPAPERSAERSGGSQVSRARPPSNLGPGLAAMADMVCAGLSAPRHVPAAEVVISVDLATFAAAFAEPTTQPAAPAEPAARLDDGPALAAATLRRMANDARLRLALVAGDGRTLDLGRSRRFPDATQLAALWRRDRGCTVPGCDRIRFLHAHHVVFWSEGGTTSLDNLLLLCGDHHRALHEGAFSITALGEQLFRFALADGTALDVAPPLWGSASDLTSAYAGIDPTAIEPDWDGTPLHADAVHAYLTVWQQRAKGNASRAA